MPKKDINQLAKSIVDQATRDKFPEETDAQKAGRLGGLKGGKARAAGMTGPERSALAKKAAKARWEKD